MSDLQEFDSGNKGNDESTIFALLLLDCDTIKANVKHEVSLGAPVSAPIASNGVSSHIH